MHTFKNKNYVILIMYNQSKATTCLKWKVSLYTFNKIVLMYLENLNLFKTRQNP